MQPAFLDLHQLVDLVEEPNKKPVINSYVNNAELVAQAPGSRKKHQAWSAGYLDHVVYSTNYGLVLHQIDKILLNSNLDYNEGDISLVMLLHDFGKIAKYKKTESGWEYLENPEKIEHEFLERTLKENNFQLTNQQKNALEFIHGEGSSYTQEKRLMSKLAVTCHQADIWNARSTPDKPDKQLLEKWLGASRHSEKNDLVQYIKDLSNLI